MNLSIFLNTAGGVGLFLYGIKMMSESLQFIAGDRMRHLIGTLTKTPLRGVFIGTLVTILIQSSTGVSVMTVSFVNAGLLTLKQAIGIIMGANIGTTVTAQIIAFNIESFALPFVAIGVIFSMAGRSKIQRYFGSGVVGLGLLFLGMHTMKEAAVLISEYKDMLLALSTNPILGVIAGIIITIIIQSSAATIGLTMALASQGFITIDACIPIILGDNIGTTLTAALAAVGASRSAKQAAAAHVLFNLLGVIIFLLSFPIFRAMVVSSSSDAGRQVANAHTIFNIANTIIFFPFVPLFAKLIEAIIPPAPVTHTEDTLYLDKKLIDASSTAAVEAVKDELMHMGDITREIFTIVRRAYLRDGILDDLKEAFSIRESKMDSINKAISSYASEIWQKGLSADGSTVLGCYVNASGDLERIGDHMENIMELCGLLCGDSDYLSPQAKEEFWCIFNTAEEAVDEALRSIRDEDTALAAHVISDLENRIDSQERQYRSNHIERLNRGECNPEKGVNFIDLLSNLERIGDHCHNIAYFTNDIVKLQSGAA